MQTRDEASKQLEESKKTGEQQWAAAQKQYQKATPSNQKASKKTWDLAQKARDEVSDTSVPKHIVPQFVNLFCIYSTSFVCVLRHQVVKGDQHIDTQSGKASGAK